SRDLDGRPATPGRHFDLEQRAAGRSNQRAVAVVRGGLQLEVRHRADRRQGLAAETEASHADEILRRSNLRGRMTLERQDGVVARHPAAVVANADELPPAVLDGDVDRRRARVQSVLNELFDNRRWALDD